MQKVENIGGTRTITVACAGNAHFAKHIVNGLKEAAELERGITAFKNNIKDYLGPVVHQYFTDYGYENAEATFIFAGSDPAVNKSVEGRRFIDLANAYTGGAGSIRVNSALQYAFPPGIKVDPGERKLNINNTDVFAIEVSPNRLDVTPTSWGEFLIYGPEGLVRDDIKPRDIAYFEFSPHSTDNGSGVGNDLTLATAFIDSQATKHGLSSVGGSVLVYENTFSGNAKPLSGKVFGADLSGFSPADLRFQQRQPKVISVIDATDPEKIYREENGTRYKLRPISRYEANGHARMYL
jgi:hypothetical protein